MEAIAWLRGREGGSGAGASLLSMSVYVCRRRTKILLHSRRVRNENGGGEEKGKAQ